MLHQCSTRHTSGDAPQEIHAAQSQTIKGGLNTQSLHLDSVIQARLQHEPLGPLPMDRFQTSTMDPFYANRYQQWSIVPNYVANSNGYDGDDPYITASQAPDCIASDTDTGQTVLYIQKCLTSLIATDGGGDNRSYVYRSCANASVRTSDVLAEDKEYLRTLSDLENVLVGVGSQFESGELQDCSVSSCQSSVFVFS